MVHFIAIWRSHITPFGHVTSSQRFEGVAIVTLYAIEPSAVIRHYHHADVAIHTTLRNTHNISPPMSWSIGGFANRQSRHLAALPTQHANICCLSPIGFITVEHTSPRLALLLVIVAAEVYVMKKAYGRRRTRLPLPFRFSFSFLSSRRYWIVIRLWLPPVAAPRHIIVMPHIAAIIEHHATPSHTPPPPQQPHCHAAASAGRSLLRCYMSSLPLHINEHGLYIMITVIVGRPRPRPRDHCRRHQHHAYHERQQPETIPSHHATVIILHTVGHRHHTPTCHSRLPATSSSSFSPSSSSPTTTFITSYTG